MVVKLDLNECVRDTPLFRKKLCQVESDIESFDNIYKKINETCQVFHSDGKRYLDSFGNMIDTFETLKAVLNDRMDDFSQNKVKNLCSLLKEARQSEEACLKDTHKLITEKISQFYESDMKKIKEAKKQFERSTNELDTVYQKNAEISKLKQLQCEEFEKSVHHCKRAFEKDGTEYIQILNQFYIIRNSSILGIFRKINKIISI